MTIEQRPYLTDNEMRDICAPLTRSDAIRRWFASNGFHFAKKPNGMPLISRAHYESVMSGTPTTAPTTAATMPNIAAFRRQFGGKLEKVA